MHGNQKMGRIWQIIVVLSAFTLFSQGFSGCDFITGASFNQESPQQSEFQKLVDSLRELQKNADPKQFQESEEDVKSRFDINSYFSVFTHLSMEQGYVLDYSLSEHPFVYVRKIDQEPLASNILSSLEMFTNLLGNGSIPPDNVTSFIRLILDEKNGVFDNKMRVDGTEEGFFEFVVLQIMGGQFHLLWHGNYDDAIVICTRDELIRVFNEGLKGVGDDEALPSYVQDTAQNIDVTPTIRFSGDLVYVTVVVFTKWGGFFKHTFIINRFAPHIFENNVKLLVSYNVGIMF